MTTLVEDAWVQRASPQDKEDFAYKLLSSLPLPNLARLQRKIAPLLQLDIIALLPTELALCIFSFLPYKSLLACALVSRRWRTLADDPSLWKNLCSLNGWNWRQAPKPRHLDVAPAREVDDDEGVGSDDEEPWLVADADSGFLSANDVTLPIPSRLSRSISLPTRLALNHSASTLVPSQPPPSKPDYKLLHQTHVLLHNRIRRANYRLTTLHPPHAHASTIYCLQLHTLPDGAQVLFTGSRDKVIRQWDLTRRVVERVFDGVHEGSVLSICIRSGYIISGGSDRRVVVWDLYTAKVIKVIEDHLDSVLCVRADDTRLVSCSKDRTVRTYLFPDFTPHLVLSSHRAAVNAVALSSTQIVSASGDRSIRLWDASTGALIFCLEGHHSRGIASIDFAPPYIISGSSDRHLRLFNTLTAHGWSTAPYAEPASPCPACGGDTDARRRALQAHRALVRSVALAERYVFSGSYDQTIKIWDRATGELITNLTGGHCGKVFCVGFDSAKIVSCGEDQRICIWDFAHGIDTSFINL